MPVIRRRRAIGCVISSPRSLVAVPVEPLSWVGALSRRYRYKFFVTISGGSACWSPWYQPPGPLGLHLVELEALLEPDHWLAACRATAGGLGPWSNRHRERLSW